MTLGGTGKEKGKRHPTIGRNVVIAAGAKVLGPITVGDDARVERARWSSTTSRPPVRWWAFRDAVVACDGQKVTDLHHENIPDPVTEMFECYNRRIDRLEQHLIETQEELALTRNELEMTEEELKKAEEELAHTEVELKRTEVKVAEAETI